MCLLSQDVGLGVRSNSDSHLVETSEVPVWPEETIENAEACETWALKERWGLYDCLI